MNKDQLRHILDAYKDWAVDKSKGHRAKLSWAVLRGAVLHEAKLDDVIIKQLQSLIIIPETGQFCGWKKGKDLNGINHLILLTIPADAKRISAISSKKCRASKVIVTRIEDMDGNERKDVTLYSPTHEDKITYKTGETIKCDNFCENVTSECAPGIYFFLRRQEAIDWQA